MLIPRGDKCVGSAQECETGSSISTLSICLAVIIPIVFVAIVVGFFAWKAYRRNKKELLEDDDPDFNGDNIILPDFPEYHPSQVNLVSDHGRPNAPFQRGPNGPPQRPGLQSHRSFAHSLDTFSVPHADSMNDINKFSRTLGYDYEDFNYPIKKISASPTKSMPGSLNASNRSSFSENSKPLTGYANSFNSNDVRRGTPLSNEKELSPVDYTATASATSPELDLDIDEKEYITEEDPSQWQPTETVARNTENVFDDSTQHEQNILHESQNVHNDINSFVESRKSVEEPSRNLEFEEMSNLDQQKNTEIVDTLEQVGESDKPLSSEEEERLNRMKSVYNVYFSRGDSVKYPNKGSNFDSENLPALPTIHIAGDVENANSEPNERSNIEPNSQQSQSVIPSLEDNHFEESHQSNEIQSTQQLAPEPSMNKAMQLTVDNGDLDPNRTSVSSSIYIANNTSGHHPHQQFLNYTPGPEMLPHNENGYEQYDYNQQQYGYPQGEGYPEGQYYPQDQYGYPPDQYGYYPDQYGYPQEGYGQPKSSYISHPLPDGKQSTPIPLPHQLAKRTSTLETFTTFKNNSHSKNPLKQMARPDDRFHPIEHAAWASVQRPNPPLQRSASSENNWKGGLESQPSPSQLRHSVVMLNPVTIGGRKVHQYKGTAKEHVRMMQQNAVPPIPEPLYGFVDGFERPHGAENLIPRSNSEIELRRELDNANV